MLGWYHNRLDRDHSRHRLDGAGDLRGDLESPRQLDLDLGALIEHQDHRHLAIGLRRAGSGRRQRGSLQPLGDALDRRRVAQEHAQPLLQLGGGFVERLGILDAGAHVVALQFGGEREQQRPARLQDVAELRQPFGEHHRLEMPGRIRQLDDAHLAAGAGASFEPCHDRTGDAAAAGARFHGAGELGP